MVYQKPTAIPGGGSYKSGSDESGLSPASLPAALENGHVNGHANGFLKQANGNAW